MRWISDYLERKRVEKKKKKQRHQIGSEWNGYEADKILKMICQAQKGGLDETGWKEVMEKLLFILFPYYDILEAEQMRNENRQETVTVPMLSVRQMKTFRSTFNEIAKGDIWAAIHRFTDFVHDYGWHKDNLLSGLEVYMICLLAQQIVDLINQEIMRNR